MDSRQWTADDGRQVMAKAYKKNINSSTYYYLTTIMLDDFKRLLHSLNYMSMYLHQHLSTVLSVSSLNKKNELDNRKLLYNFRPSVI